MTKPTSLTWLVFGSDGFIGKQLCVILGGAGQKVVAGRRVASFADAEAAIAAAKPQRVVCALGRTHTPQCATIDGLESPAALPDLQLANHDAPLWIAKAAAAKLLHVLYLGTGCIYTGEGIFTEEDPPNFTGSAYSRVKAQTDADLQECSNVLIARIRMPVAAFDSPRDLLCKLWTYAKICDDGPNSVTVLPEILPSLLALAHYEITGVVNAVNPEALSHPAILAIFAETGRSHEHTVVSDPAELRLRAPRSRCALSAARLQTLLQMLPPWARAIYGAPEAIGAASVSLARIAELRRLDRVRLLVTGGCGFIGSHFVEDWLCRRPYDEILNVDSLDAASGAASKNVTTSAAGYQLLQMDLTCETSVGRLTAAMQWHNVTEVIHFAARTHVDESFDGRLSLEYTKVNALGTHHLLEACRNYGRLQRFLHISTDEIYGDTSAGMASEASLMKPTNPYAASKAAAEMLVHAYGHSLDLPCMVLRLNNVYGPRQHITKVIPKFAIHAHGHRELPLHGTGAVRRSFLHVDDAIRAVEVVLLKGTLGEAYNAGGGHEVSVKELAEAINLTVGQPQSATVQVQDRPYNDRRYFLDDSKLRALGWAPSVPFDEGLRATVQSYAFRV